AACDFRGDAELMAIATSSHSGEPWHRQALERLQNHLAVGHKALQLQPCYPLSPEQTFELKQAGKPPAILYHPCCGKHLVYAAAALQFSPEESYTSLTHPLQKRLQTLLEGYLGHASNWTRDSCGLPTLIAPIADHLKLWAEL